MSGSEQPTRYDVLRYPSKPYAYAHVDRLSVVGSLFGIEPPDVRTARVLELGCGSGGHLLPMAHQLPDATFLGVDLAPTSIEEAREHAAALGLNNIQFDVADLAAMPDDLGEFDYIMAHGVFSWVPKEAREGLLNTLSARLAHNGIGYISYNVLPGWHLHRVVRDLLRMHAELFEDPQQQIEQALSMLSFMKEATEGDTSAYATLLRRESKMLGKHTPGYIFHDFMAPINEPMLFRDFIGLAEEHGLSYLGDVDFGDMLPAGLPDRVSKMLMGVSNDLVALEQYLDFLRGNSFRRSLLMKGPQDYDRNIHGSVVRNLYACMTGHPKAGEIDLASDKPAGFESRDGATVTVTMPLAKAALAQLSMHYPADVSVRELTKLARSLLPKDQPYDPEEDLRLVGGALIHAFGAGLVSLVPRDRGHASEVSERPCTDAYSRYQLRESVDIVTNRRHESAHLGRFEQVLARLCDGTRDYDQLVDACVEAVANGELTVKIEDEETTDPEQVHAALYAALEPHLLSMMKMGLFER